jgi:hypothetical protein
MRSGIAQHPDIAHHLATMASASSIKPNLLCKAGQSAISRPPSACNSLPVELVQRIFHLAAASSRHSCLSICLVASWGRHIALPYLFHTIVIEDIFSFSKFEKNIANPAHLPASFSCLPASVVNGVWMENDGRGHYDQILTVMEACDNITHFAMQTGFFHSLVCSSSPRVDSHIGEKIISRRALARNQDLRLTILGAEHSSSSWVLRKYHEDDLMNKSPIFNMVTHLRLTAISLYKPNIRLDHFSHLSHFAVPYYDDSYHDARHLQPLLELESLKMLVISVPNEVNGGVQWKGLDKWVRKVREMDDRVYLVGRSSIFLRDEWESEMRGGESIWERAVQFTYEWEVHATA